MYIYFPPLITSRLIIREFENSDIDDLFAFLASEKVADNLTWYPYTDINKAQNWLDRAIREYSTGSLLRLAIEHEQDKRVIGFIGLSTFDLSATTCQVVYGIHENYWGRGLVPEALDAFIDYLFKEENKELIIGTHLKKNPSSGRVMEKCGFKRCVTRDTSMMIKGVNEKLTAYTITKGAYYEKD